MKVIFISNKTFVQHSRFETCHIFLFPFIFHLEKISIQIILSKVFKKYDRPFEGFVFVAVKPKSKIIGNFNIYGYICTKKGRIRISLIINLFLPKLEVLLVLYRYKIIMYLFFIITDKYILFNIVYQFRIEKMD